MKRQRKPYVASSLRAAQNEVRRCRNQIDRLVDLIERFGAEQKQLQAHRRALAKVAADGPAFFNPLEAAAAKTLRDQILREECRLNPDGSPLAGGGR